MAGVGNENLPYGAAGMPKVNGKGRTRRSSAVGSSPLVERTRDMLKNVSQVDGNEDSATPSKGKSRPSKNPRRQTADVFELADVLQSLDSPATSSHTGEHANLTKDKQIEPPSSAAKANRRGDSTTTAGRHKRRETADFSTLHSLLDTSASSAAFSDTASSVLRIPQASVNTDISQSLSYTDLSPSEAREAEIRQGGDSMLDGDSMLEALGVDEDGDDTADFSSLMGLVQGRGGEGGAPANAHPTRSTAIAHSSSVDKKVDVEGGGSGTPGSSWSERAAAIRPRAPYLGHRGGDTNRLVPQPSVPLGAVLGTGVVGGAPGPTTRKPRSPPRRPRRSINLDPSLTPTTSWEGSATPTSKGGNQRRKSMVLPMQPAFEHPANIHENSDDLSGDISSASNHGRGVDNVGASTSGGDGSEMADTGDLFSATLSAVSDREVDDDAEREGMAIDMGTIVAELEREAVRGGGGREENVDAETAGNGRRERDERRQTAEKLTVDSLLDQIDSPMPVIAMSAAGRSTKAREEYEASSAGTTSTVGLPKAAADTPKSGRKRKKKTRESRRLTADLSSLHDLLQDSPKATTAEVAPASPVSVTGVYHDDAATGTSRMGEQRSELSPTHFAGRVDSRGGDESTTASGDSRPTADRAALLRVSEESAATAPSPAPEATSGASAAASRGGDDPEDGLIASDGGQATADYAAVMNFLVSDTASHATPSINFTPTGDTDAARGSTFGIPLTSPAVAARRFGHQHASGIMNSNAMMRDGFARAPPTPSSAGAASILESTPSPTGGISQCLADGSALRGEQKLAPLRYGEDPRRRLTCDRRDFQGVFADLESPSSTAASSADGRGSIGSIGSSPLDARSVAEGSAGGGGGDASVASSYGNSSELARTRRMSAETAESDYSDESASPAALAAADKAAAVDVKMHSTPPGVAQRQKQGRRTTASPSALEDLMSHIGDDRESDELEDDCDCDSDAGIDSLEPRASPDTPLDGVEMEQAFTRDSAEAVAASGRTSRDSITGTSEANHGDASTPSPGARTPSPPVARRTRSKSPSSTPKNKGNKNSEKPPPAEATASASKSTSAPREEPPTKAGDSSKASPSAGVSSPRVAAKTGDYAMLLLDVKASASKLGPGSARAPLKSCLSSRKRARGTGSAAFSDITASTKVSAGVAAIASGAALAPPATPDHVGRNQALMSPPRSRTLNAEHGEISSPSSARDPSAGAAKDVALSVETPRRVVFGDPMAAEFNHSSPSNRLTPMPSRDARSLFPLEKRGSLDEDTDDDEDTMANSAQLAQWDSVEPAEMEDSFEGFEGVVLAGDEAGACAAEDVSDSIGRDGEDALLKPSPSPARNRRRQSLGPKSPLSRSLAAFSAKMTTSAVSESARAPFSPSSMFDSDCEDATANHLNASISGAGVPRSTNSALPTIDNRERSFSISTSRMHDLSDSDSSMSLTGNFGSPITFAATSTTAIAALSAAPAAAAEKGRGTARVVAPMAIEENEELNDSSELAYTLCSSSVRDATSPAGSRRASSGSLMDIVSQVDEIEERLISEAQERAPHGSASDQDDIVSPINGRAKSSVAALRGASPANGGDGDPDDNDDTMDLRDVDASESVWQLVLAQVQHGKAGGSRLPTVREEAEDHHDDASGLVMSSADSTSNNQHSIGGGGGGSSRRSSSGGTERRESNATVSLPGDWSLPMSENEFEGGAGVSNNGRRGSLRRESQCSSLDDVTMDVETLPDTRAATATACAGRPRKAPSSRRSSVAGIGAVSRVAEDCSSASRPAADSFVGLIGVLDGVDDEGNAGEDSVPAAVNDNDHVFFVPASTDALDDDTNSSSRDVNSNAATVSAVVSQEEDDDVNDTRDTAENAGTMEMDSSPFTTGNAFSAIPGMRPPRPRRSASSRSSLASTKPSERVSVGGAGCVGGNGRRATLQAMIGSKRRATFTALPTPSTARGRRKRTSEGGDPSLAIRGIRRRLSSSSSAGPVTMNDQSDVSGDISGVVTSASSSDEPTVKTVPDVAVKPASNVVFAGGVGGTKEQVEVEGGMAEHPEEGTAAAADQGEDDGGTEPKVDRFEGDDDEEDDKDAAPLAMTIEELMMFVAPEMATEEGQAIAIASAVVPGSSALPDDMHELPDRLVTAMAATLDAAAAEMERKVSLVAEQASDMKEMAWRLHTDAPVLAEIDRAILQGDTDGTTGMTARARAMTALIKAELEKEWGSWEVQVLDRLANDHAKVLDEVSQAQQRLAARTAELREMESQAEMAEYALMRNEFRANVRSRMEKGAAKMAEAQSEASAAEEEMDLLRQELREKRGRRDKLKEGKARREERKIAAAKRAAAVSHLLEVEGQAIAKEMEALDAKEMLDVQLGLRLWCQPVRLHRHQVVLAFAAPHSPSLRHELTFDLSEKSTATARVVTTVGNSKKLPRNKAVVSVGDVGSASFRLSRMMFEGDNGLFSIGAGGCGGAVEGLQGVERATDVGRASQNVEWYVGRAYSLLQEVHKLEKEYACTVAASDVGDGIAAGATLCIELANWRSRRQLRLRFRVATTYACCVGNPEVEVEIGSLEAAAVTEAIRKAGAHRAGLMAITKAVESAAGLISS